MAKTIGISKRISIQVLEMAMKAALDENFSAEFAADLAAGEFQGANRIEKARSVIGKITQRNPLFSFIQENKQDFLTAIKYKGDRAVIYTAIINAAYEFGYDTTAILGKFFHVQDEVTSQLIVSRLSSIYASNRTLPVGLYCILPMYIEAGLIDRPKVGKYVKCNCEIVTSFARELYKKSFFVNNPMLREDDYDYLEHSYFEFM